MKILFVCKHNRFRSKVAECIFGELNKNSKNSAESAGILLDPVRPYIADSVVKVMKEKGYSIEGKPEQFNKKMLKAFGMLIIVANNIEEELFSDFKGRVMRWNIFDCDECNINSIKKIIDEIERKVRDLINML
jgi:protein-tyrosine-phosphatase